MISDTILGQLVALMVKSLESNGIPCRQHRVHDSISMWHINTYKFIIRIDYYSHSDTFYVKIGHRDNEFIAIHIADPKWLDIFISSVKSYFRATHE